MANMKLLPGKTIIIEKFPTHMAYTRNKRAPARFMKITNESIYNGAIDRFSRANVVSNMHDLIIHSILGN